MKKILALFIIFMLTLSLCACGNSGNINNIRDDSSNISNNNSAIQNEDTNVESNDGYKVKVDDKTFTFPCDYKNIKNAGYIISADDVTKVLNSTLDYELVNVTKNDQQAFGIYIVKDGSNIDEAQVLGVILRSNTDNVFSINGLEIGKATVKDTVTVLGKPEEPQEYDETSYLLTFTYEQRKLTLNLIDGILDAVYVLEEAK